MSCFLLRSNALEMNSQKTNPLEAFGHAEYLKLRCKTLSARQGEIDGDGRIHLHRFAVQNVGPIAPLFHRLHSCLIQQWGSRAYDAQVLNGTVFPDHGGQHDRTLHTRDFSHLRVLGRDVVDLHTLRYALRNADALHGDFGNRDRRRADDATDNAVGRSSRNASRDTSHHARRWRRGLFFLDDLHLLGNLCRGAELVVNDVRLDLFDYLDCGRRRWWWRRRRRRHQESHQLTFGQSLGKHQRNEDENYNDN